MNIQTELRSISGYEAWDIGGPGLLREAADRIDDLEKALKPFVLMHRVGNDDDELACERGSDCDKTILINKDFKQAFETYYAPRPK